MTNANAKTGLIVGASRGIGLGLATELAARGWRVIATARKPAQATALQALSTRSGGRVEIEQIDVDSSGDLDGLASRLSGRELDLLVLNAGIGGPEHQSLERATREEVAQLVWTNALAPLLIANRLLPQVRKGGTVAFMSSILGSVAGNTSGGYELYRVSKASLNTLTRGFAAGSAKDRNVAVLSLHPGWVRTDMGGEAAPLSVEESTRGLADVLEARRPPIHVYLDYQGQEIPW